MCDYLKIRCLQFCCQEIFNDIIELAEGWTKTKTSGVRGREPATTRFQKYMVRKVSLPSNNTAHEVFKGWYRDGHIDRPDGAGYAIGYAIWFAVVYLRRQFTFRFGLFL